jgi:hypothetical protein
MLDIACGEIGVLVDQTGEDGHEPRLSTQSACDAGSDGRG